MVTQERNDRRFIRFIDEFNCAARLKLMRVYEAQQLNVHRVAACVAKKRRQHEKVPLFLLVGSCAESLANMLFSHLASSKDTFQWWQFVVLAKVFRHDDCVPSLVFRSRSGPSFNPSVLLSSKHALRCSHSFQDHPSAKENG